MLVGLERWKLPASLQMRLAIIFSQLSFGIPKSGSIRIQLTSSTEKLPLDLVRQHGDAKIPLYLLIHQPVLICLSVASYVNKSRSTSTVSRRGAIRPRKSISQLQFAYREFAMSDTTKSLVIHSRVLNAPTREDYSKWRLTGAISTGGQDQVNKNGSSRILFDSPWMIRLLSVLGLVQPLPLINFLLRLSM